jgi:hypothetical protein
MGAAAVTDLKRALESRFPDALPLARTAAAAVTPTGLGALDALLPGGGLARGRVTVWQPGGGSTAVLRAAGEAAALHGGRSAWIDVARQQAADFWRPGPLLVRPRTEREALSGAEELLRSGGFALVVLAGGGRDAVQEMVRLSRAARAGGAAFVALLRESPVAHLRVVSRLSPEGYRWRRDPFGEPVELVSARVEIEASSLGWSGRTALELPVRMHQPRLAPEPRLVDRRGAPPAARWRPSRPSRPLRRPARA